LDTESPPNVSLGSLILD